MAKSATYQAMIALGAKLDKTFGPTIKSAQKGAQAIGKGFQAAAKTTAIATTAIGVGFAAVTAAAIKMGVSVVKQFGELEQNLGGSEAVFGEYALKIQKIGEDAYKNLGVSQSDYLATANKMGALFQGSGIEQEKSLELTEKAMQRAADMASVMGIDMQVALDSVAGAAKGNFTMMDNLGVAMNATNIQAYALANGFDFTWSKATQAEKAEMAMRMFFENTEQYAGNFARESTETITGSLGLLKAASQSFMGGLGNSNADMQNLTKNLTDAFQAVVKNVVPIFKNIASALPDAFEAIVPAVGDILPMLLDTIPDLMAQVLKTGTKLLPKLVPVAVKAVKMIAKALVDNVPMLVDTAAEMGRGIFKSIGEAVPWLMPALDAIQEALGELFTGLKGGDAKTTLLAVAKTASQLLVPAINLAKSAIKTIIKVFQQVAPVVAPIIDKIVTLAKKFMEMADVVLPVLGDVFSAVFTNFLETVTPVIDGISTALEGFMDFITGVFTGDWEQAWQGITDIFGGAFDALVGLAKAPLNSVIGLINKAINGINGASFQMPDWSPIMPGETVGINIPNIPMLYTGVRNFSGGAAIVGERGPEVVNLPRGADVFNNRETGSIFSRLRDFGEQVVQIVVNAPITVNGPIAKEQAHQAATSLRDEIERVLAELERKKRRVSFAG